MAFGDATDRRVLDAAAIVRDAGIVPVLVRPDCTRTSSLGNVAPGIETVDPGDTDPLAFLARYVRSGAADAGIAGSLSTSASVIRAGIRGLGATGLVTGCFLIDQGGAAVTYADCSVVPDPTAEQLAEIAAAAADHHRALTREVPRVAMLSFSTGGSAEHPAVEKVRRATALVRRLRPDLTVEGELQFDVAVDPGVGSRKLPTSEVAGRANVLVFPSLDAGNIAYKVAERVGGARAIGSFVLNLSAPWADVSRGCSTADLADTARLLARAACLRRRNRCEPSERTT
ncbi:phosphate acyltransferase [Sphaerisporangium sp. NPDC051017]|uniref:phosphate acyltransferase n=1 Tax=Sphaerisporangium sp. NPDC051017 TaxID=3154636 RepID=UPI003426821F